MDNALAAEKLEALIAVAKTQTPRDAIKTLSGYTFGVASETKAGSIKMVADRAAMLRRQAERERFDQEKPAPDMDWFEMILAS